MEGLVDAPLRAVISKIGGLDWCVTEFVRVTNTLLPAKTFRRMAPESANGWRTPSSLPLMLQLLGSDPICLADNAARAAELGAPGIDLNFGCPAKTVNRHRGGAALLQEPELLEQIVVAVRRAVPAHIPVTAKMRLGFADTSLAIVCAQALAAGGAGELVVHARTKVDAYKPPAHWHWIAKIKEAVNIPVVANGEIWTVDDYLRCRAESGCADVMLGRGLVARPDLALQIRATVAGQIDPSLSWDAMEPHLQDFFAQVAQFGSAAYAPSRLKQWLGYLKLSYPQADQMFRQIRQQQNLARLPDMQCNIEQ